MSEPALDVKGRNVEALVRYARSDGPRHRFLQGEADRRAVVVRDMRSSSAPPNLHREGFMLAHHRTAVTDFTNGEQVASIYLEEVRVLLRRLIGSEDVYMQQNWVLRADDGRTMGSKAISGGRQVTSMSTGQIIHVDYDPDSAVEFARAALAAAGVRERPKGRLLGINTWRSISPPPQDKPLALLDRRSVDVGDFVEADMGIPLNTGKQWASYELAYSPEHRFCWWSNMTPDELLIFVQFDEGFGLGSGVAHTAFEDLSCPPKTRTRESIEARAYVFLGD